MSQLIHAASTYQNVCFIAQYICAKKAVKGTERIIPIINEN